MSEAPPALETPIICVLGMHRSGTSLITRVLNLLGMYLGPEDHLMKPDKFNPKGYWEHRSIVDLDDNILKQLGGSWRDPPPFPPGWEGSSRFAELRQQARALIQDNFGAALCWGWKDPRTCLTLPFWKQLLPPLRFVICVRNPVDVARSLAHTMPMEKAVDLWHYYTKASLEHTAGQPRHFVFYEDFMEDWRQEWQRLARFVGNQAAEPGNSVCDAVREVVVDELHHHRTSLQGVVDEARLAFPAKALYTALRFFVGLKVGTRQKQEERQFQETFNVFSRYCFEAREHLEELQSQRARHRESVEEWEEKARQLASRDAALRDVQFKLEAQAAQIREHEARGEQQRLQLEEQRVHATELACKVDALGREAEGLRQELAMRNMLIVRLEAGVAGFQASCRDEVREQGNKVRDPLGDPDGPILARLEGLPQLGGRGQPAAVPTLLANGLASPKDFEQQEYHEMIGRVRRLVATELPANATTAVVSKGDPELLQLEGRPAWHFPQQDDGSYTGFHPKDSTAAIEQLQRIRAKGAQFLLFPATAFWWLDHYRGFAAHLGSQYRVVARDEQTCVIFALQEGSGRQPLAVQAKTQQYGHLVRQLRGFIDTILPPDTKVIVVSQGDPALVDLGRRVAWHFPQDSKGGYAGYDPVDSITAIAQLEVVRQRGAHFLVVPKTAAWWFDHYQDFGQYLEANYRAVARQRHVCTIFDLNGR